MVDENVVYMFDGGDSRDIFSPICCGCKHAKLAFGHHCAAFPDRIPDAIWKGENDHITPYPGDNGIQFEHRLPK